MVEHVLRLSSKAKSVSLISVQGSSPFWSLHGFKPTGLTWEALESYGPTALHMVLDKSVTLARPGENPALEGSV